MTEPFFHTLEGLSSVFHHNIYMDFIIGTLILIFFLLIKNPVTTSVLKVWARVTDKTKTNLDNNILHSFEKPIRAFIVVIGIYLAFLYLPLDHAKEAIAHKTFRSMIIISLCWGIYNLTKTYSSFIVEIGKRFGITVDELLVPFLTKITRPLILFLGISIVADIWEYNVSALITGLGIGGLAFALAAQDALKNVFGGVIIITEKPFAKGDWIQTPSVEGTVEDITFRSTVIRTFAQALVIIPNSTLANEPITNWTQMGKRRITFNLGVEYKTSRTKIQNVISKIERMLKNRYDIDQETIFVKFSEFNDSSLDIFLYFFTKTTNWEEWLDVKQDCNLQIMKILEEEGVGIAFPSQSVYFENHPETQLANVKKESLT